MGKFLRSMGQDRISVSLEEAEEKRGLLGLPHRRQEESFASPLGRWTGGEGFYLML